VGQFGVTECQIIAVTVHILTGIFGQQFWQVSLFDFLPAGTFAHISNKFALEALKEPIGGLLAYYIGIVILLLSVFEVFRTLYQTKKYESLKEFFSLGIITLNCFAWTFFSFFKEHIGIVLFSFGFLIALLVCKLIISSVTKMKPQVFHQELFPLIAATLFMALF